jgi:putative ABC transport system permease protein
MNFDKRIPVDNLKLKDMLYTYISIAWRNLLKNRVVSFINISGLTLGLASAVLAILFARHELNYESVHENGDRINRIYLGGSFGVVEWAPQCFGPEGPALREMFPVIEEYSVSRMVTGIARVGESLFREDNILVADSGFYSLFTVPFIAGEPSTDPLSVVLSETTSGRYFGKENPLGEIITIELSGEKIDFTVTGVYRDFPSNTHLNYGLILPFALADRFNWKYNEYQNGIYISYVYVREGTDIEQLNRSIRDSYEIPVQIEDIHAFLMPLKDIHFKGTFSNNRGKFLALLIGGFFVLITSVFNYINLTNILFATRKKEVGIRKVNGATRADVIKQFLTDTMLSTVLGFILAIVLLQSILPWFNALMDTSIILTADRQFILYGLLLIVVTILFSGLYPAIRYSAIQTSNLLKDINAIIAGKNYSRYILTTFQFILAVIFIQLIMVLQSQGKHMDNEDVMGYVSENVICLTGRHWGDLNAVKTELLANPAVEAVTWGSTIPSFGVSQTANWKDEDNRSLAAIYRYEKDFPEVYNIAMEAGRFFSDNFPADKENSLVINRETAAFLELSDPVGNTTMLHGRQYNIIGVIDRYMAMPPIFGNTPSLYIHSGDSDEFLMIRINPLNRESTHEYITSVLNGFNPDYPVEIKYHDEVLYETTEAKSFVSAMQLMQLFFLLTIIASLVGLFGLSMFIAQKYRKEVGVRKVFGASVGSVMIKISRELIIQVSVAILIATPVAVVVANGFLSVFAYRIEPGILFFLTGGSFALILVVLTVSWQTWVAANRNPADILRYE